MVILQALEALFSEPCFALFHSNGRARVHHRQGGELEDGGLRWNPQPPTSGFSAIICFSGGQAF